MKNPSVVSLEVVRLVSEEEREQWDSPVSPLAIVRLSVPASQAINFPVSWALQQLPWDEDSFCLFLCSDGQVWEGSLDVGPVVTNGSAPSDVELLCLDWFETAVADAYVEEPDWESGRVLLSAWAVAKMGRAE